MATTTEQRAQALYDQAQQGAAHFAAMGMTIPAGRIQAATYEQVAAHVALCDELSARYRVTLDPVAMWGQDVPARALAKARANAGRRGVKALEAKYGRAVAEEIVYAASGKHIQ